MLKRILLLILVVAGLMAAASSDLSSSAYTDKISYQGILQDSTGGPVTPGFYGITFRIYSTLVGGTAKWQETQPVLCDSNGMFSVLLGNNNPLNQWVFSNLLDASDMRPRWLEIEVEGDLITPRTLLACVPFAEVAARITGDAYSYTDSSSGTISFFVSTDTSGDTLVRSEWEVRPMPTKKIGGVPDGVARLLVIDQLTGDTLSAITNVVDVEGTYSVWHYDAYDRLMARVDADSAGFYTIDPSGAITGYIKDVSSPSDDQAYFKGRVGVGVLSPSAKLHVVENDTSAAIAGKNSGSGAGIKAVNDGTGAAIVGTAASGDLLRLVSTSPGNLRLVVDNDGNLCLDGTITQQGGCDVAENMTVIGNLADYEPGDVLVLSAQEVGHLELTSRPYCQRVVGVYSTVPGFHLGSNAFGHEANQVPIALSGIVPVKVCNNNGAIKVGDLLVTSSQSGRAMKATDQARAFGSVIGKAMEPMDAEHGIVKVLVTLQ